VNLLIAVAFCVVMVRYGQRLGLSDSIQKQVANLKTQVVDLTEQVSSLKARLEVDKILDALPVYQPIAEAMLNVIMASKEEEWSVKKSYGRISFELRKKNDARLAVAKDLVLSFTRTTPEHSSTFHLSQLPGKGSKSKNINEADLTPEELRAILDALSPFIQSALEKENKPKEDFAAKWEASCKGV
jgi:hypothetical protein